MADCFIAWCKARCQPALQPLTTCVESQPELHGEADEKRVQSLHDSASLWHIDKWWAETWKPPPTVSLLPSPSPAVGSCDSWVFLCLSPFFLQPSKVAASVWMQLLGISFTSGDVVPRICFILSNFFTVTQNISLFLASVQINVTHCYLPGLTFEPVRIGGFEMSVQWWNCGAVLGNEGAGSVASFSLNHFLSVLSQAIIFSTIHSQVHFSRPHSSLYTLYFALSGAAWPFKLTNNRVLDWEHTNTSWFHQFDLLLRW